MNELHLISGSAYSLKRGSGRQGKKEQKSRPHKTSEYAPRRCTFQLWLFLSFEGEFKGKKKEKWKKRKEEKRLRESFESCIPTKKEGT